MLFLSLLFSTIVILSIMPQSHEKIRVKRIVNGQRAVKIPYQVSIELDGYHQCGGSIISRLLVLTAAHCLKPDYKGHLAVRTGSNKRQEGGELIPVKDFLVHPNFTSDVFDNDIALISLKIPLNFNKNVSAIQLADAYTKPYVGKMALISGWGYETEDSGYLADYLMFGVIRVLNSNLCKDIYEGFSPNRMICAGLVNGSVDACNRDSGGPLVQDYRLIGIISAGLGCGRKELPGAYTNVAYYRKWIDRAKNVLIINSN